MAGQPQEKRKRRSLVWDYFSHEGQCKKCDRFYQVHTGRDGTSSIRNHLKCKHRELYDELLKKEAERDQKKKQETRSSNGDEEEEEENGERRAGREGRVQRVQKKKAHEDAAPVPAPSRPVGSSGGEPELEECTRYLAQLIVMCGLDPLLLDKECFRIFLTKVNPNYRLPPRDAISRMCDGIIAEEQEYLKAKLKSCPGRVTLAVGRTQTIRGEAIYTTCHFIDEQWKLHRVLLDAYVVAPAIGYHDPLIGVNEVTPLMLPERVVADCLELGITLGNLHGVAGEMTDDFQSCIIYEIKQLLMEKQDKELNHCTTNYMARALQANATYIDSVLHSTARCLVLDQEFTNEVFGDVQIYNMNRKKREWLFPHLRLDSPLEYGEQWYSWYCTLKTMHRGFNAVEGSEAFVGIVCKVWGAIHLAIQRVSTTSCPASDLCPVLLKVSDALKTEIDNAHVSLKFKGFQAVRSVVDVLRHAKDTLDKAIQDSYLLWSLSLAFDPRYKLTTPIFERVFGSEAAENKIDEVKSTMHYLYTDYSTTRGGNQLDCYLEDDVERAEVFDDVLNWWKDDGMKRYPTVAEMARNVLATPMCGRLRSDNMAHVSSIVRGYTQEKHIRPEEEEVDNDVEQQETPEVVDGDFNKKIVEAMVIQQEMLDDTRRKMTKVKNSNRSMEKRILSLEREVRAFDYVEWETAPSSFQVKHRNVRWPDNDESALKNSREYAKTVGKDASPEKDTRKRKKLNDDQSDIQIRSSEKMLKPIKDKNAAYNYQTPISIQDFRCTDQDKATMEYIDASLDEQRLVCISKILLDAKDLKKFRQPHTWLNNDIITAYISCLKEDGRLRNRENGKVYLEYPTFTQRFKENGTNLRQRGEPQFHSWVQERANEYIKHDMVFLPINVPNSHWYLAVINTKQQTIQVLDSQGPLKKKDDKREELTTTLIGLESYLKNIPQDIRSMQHKWKNVNFTFSPWEVRDEVKSQMQTERSSCGLFMLKYMECWTGTELSPYFTQEDIDGFRQRLPVLLVDSKHNLTPGGPKSSKTDSKGNDSTNPITIY